MSDPKKRVQPLNPWSKRFLEQIPIVNTMLAQHRARYSAQERLKNVLEGYKELVKDPRYKLVHEDLKLAMGDQLAILIEEAVKCKACNRYATPIKMMTEVVLDPVDQIWYENQRARLEEQGGETA